MGNIISTIHNEEDYQLKKHPRPALDKLPERKFSTARQPASWTRDIDKLARRTKRWAQKKKYNKATFEFLTSRSLIERNRDSLTWEATDLLGAGSFGVVGMWQQIDSKGEVRDAIAVKETTSKEPHGFIEMFERRDGKDSIPTEALWMDFLSRRTPYIPNLRQLVRFEGKKWRFYMEYCANGTIYELINVYKEYNDTHDPSDEQVIPEPYVWFVFYSMAQALQAMDIPQGTAKWVDRDLRHQVPTGDRFVLHLDIKDENTLLGKSATLKDLTNYPPAKLGDYGLAQLTHKRHLWNSNKFRGCGTVCWMAPEQYDMGNLDYRWKTDAIHPGHNPRYPYDQRHGVWQVAAIIYGMVSQTIHNQELYTILEDIVHDPKGEAKSLERGLSMLKYRNSSIRDDYSDRLYKTLDRCLNLSPAKRPFPDQLIKTCEGAMADMGEQLHKTRRAKPPVFYGPNAKYELRDHVKRRRRSPPPRRRRARQESALPVDSMEEAKTIIRTAVRTFQHNHIQSLLVDTLIHHSVLHLDDFYALTTIPQKELRGYLQPLRTVRLIHTHARREHQLQTQRDANREYYYIHHSDAVNTVKYRLNKLRQEIQNQYLTASGPETLKCPRCNRTWNELDIMPVNGMLPCPKCNYPDVGLNEAAFKNQGAHESIQLLNSQLSKFNMLFAAFDAKLGANQFKELKFEEQFQRRKIVPKSAGGRSWQWVDVKRGRERETAAGAVDENALDLNITSAARQAAEEATRERDRKEKIAAANLKPEWIQSSVVKGGTLDIRGEKDDPPPTGAVASTATLKKEEPEDEKKPLHLLDGTTSSSGTGPAKSGSSGAAPPDADRDQQALMEQYMLDMQREQEEAARKQREQNAADAGSSSGEEEDDDEEDDFEDVPGTDTGTPAVDTPASSQDIKLQPHQLSTRSAAAVSAVNGLKREYDDDSSEAATPASEDRDRDSKRLKIEGDDIKTGANGTAMVSGALPVNPAKDAVKQEEESEEEEEFEDV